MSLGQIDRYEAIDQTPSTTEQQATTPQSLSDLQKITSPENQVLLADIQENAEDNLQEIMPAIIQIGKDNPQHNLFYNLLQIITENPQRIDSGEIHDQWKKIIENNKKNQLLSQKDKIIAQEKAETANNETIIKGENEKQAQENEKQAQENEKQAQEKEKQAQKDINAMKEKEIMQQQFVIALENANKIHPEKSEKFQQVQKEVEEGLRIDEAKLADSPLQKSDIAKLAALQSDESLREEDIFNSDAEKAELQTYLSDGSFDALKNDLGIIDSLDDLGQPEAFKQIDGMDDAHEGDFDLVLENDEQSEKFGELAGNIVQHLPVITYQEGGQTKVNQLAGQDVVRDLGLSLDDPTTFIKALAFSQQEPSENQEKALAYVNTIIGKHLHQQTTETIKNTTKQNYLSHIASLFGEMGEDIQTDPSRMSYDENGGLTIDFSIDGYDFHNPLRIGDHITGPSILDRHQGGVMGQETVAQLGNMKLTTMNDMISSIRTDSITNAQSLDEYKQALASFGRKQANDLNEGTEAQKVSVTRYATKLKAHLESRSLISKMGTMDRITDDNVDTEGGHLDDDRNQPLYEIIAKTTEHNSTAENRKLIHATKKLKKYADSFSYAKAAMHGFSTDDLADPMAKQLLRPSEDSINRAENFFTVFLNPQKGSLNVNDLGKFADYIDHIVTAKKPKLTFDEYLAKEGQTISTISKMHYGDIASIEDAHSADNELEEQLALLA